MGRLGIPLQALYEFYDMRSLSNHIRGYWQHITTLERTQWETTRWQTFHLLNVHLKQPIQSIKEFAVFHWENTKTAIKKTPLQKEDMQKIKQAFNQ